MFNKCITCANKPPLGLNCQLAVVNDNQYCINYCVIIDKNAKSIHDLNYELTDLKNRIAHLENEILELRGKQE